MLEEITLTGGHLILGGARSGKSAYAEKLLEQSKQPLYIATAEAGDDEMQERIDHHQQQRGGQWQLIEAPIGLADAVNTAPVEQAVLIDCLTLWLSNCLHNECWQREQQKFLEALVSRHTGNSATTIMVSNEVGHGVVPLGELSRRYVDELGRLHQTLAQQCQRVTFVVAGLPQRLKG